MKVLVTGATGFIGGNLARHLSRQGYQVRALVRPGGNTLTIDGTDVEVAWGDILDRESVARAAQGCQSVFHCAAAYTFWSREPGAIYRANVEGTRTVLEAALSEGVQRVVYTSTVGTIGDCPGGLSTEDTPVDPRHLVGHYKRSKYQAEQAALEFHARRGLPVVVVNPTVPVGPWDVKPTPTGRIVLDFLRGRVPAYLETGMNLVDVADVVSGHVLALEKGEPGQRYLLGNRNLALKDVFHILQDITGRKSPRWRIPFWAALAGGYVDYLVEGKLLGREPRVPLEGVKVARRPIYVDCRKAVDQLGLPQSPVEAALEEAVWWFRSYGYVK